MLDILGYAAFFLTTALTYGLICLGLNIQWGMTGLFNVGVAGFVAIGAYVSALLTAQPAAGRLIGPELPILLGWFAGAAAAGLAAALVGAVEEGGLARQPGEGPRNEGNAEGPARQVLRIQRHELDRDRDAEGGDGEIVGAQPERNGAHQRGCEPGGRGAGKPA